MKRINLAIPVLLSFAAGQGANASGYEPYDEPLTNSEAAFSGAMFTNNTEIMTPQGIIDTPAPAVKLIPALPQPTFNSVEMSLPPETTIEPAAGTEASTEVATPAPQLPHTLAGDQPDLTPGE